MKQGERHSKGPCGSMAGVVMEFDMGAETPRGGSKGQEARKRAAAAEAFKKELGSKVRVALLKLKDRDTQQQAILEMQKVCDELRPEHVSIVHTALFGFDGEKSSFARAQSARLFADVAKAQFEVKTLSRVVTRLCERAKDNDSKVREACAETIGELARIFCSSPEYSQPIQPLAETQDLDASVAETAGPSLNVFFNPILKHMEQGDTNGQIGNALALAHVVFNSQEQLLPYLEQLTKRILTIMDRSNFLGRSDLLIAIANIVEVCPDGFTPHVEQYFTRIMEASQDKDFNVRKAAMETVETLASRIDPDVMMNFRDSIKKMLDTCRYDTKPPVRDAAQAAIKAVSEMENVYNEKHGIEACADQSHMGSNDNVENEDPLDVSQSSRMSAPAATERVPMRQMNRSHSNKSETSIDTQFSKPARVAPLKGVGGQGGWDEETMPSKDTWNQLLLHFDRMTQQQTQLIEMVSSFGDSSRDRLEALEQKVYSIELRMSGIEKRQSFSAPGMPPTPARAARTGFTPSGTPVASTPARMAASTPLLAAHKEVIAEGESLVTSQECA